MFIPILIEVVKGKMKNKVFTAAIILELTLTTFLVISPVLAQSYWGNEAEEADIPPMYGGGYENDTMSYCDQNGTYNMPYWREDRGAFDGAPYGMPHMDSSEDGPNCGDPKNGAHDNMMSSSGGMMGGSGAMMSNYSPSSRRNGMNRPS